jgi:asparagine synthase (glutamine-hydrolysing)
LACIRQHSAVTDRLNESAIADFLLFESNQDPASTTFADIQRLPAGSRLICSAQSVKLERYWSLSADLGVRYRDHRDYVWQFRDLLEQAITDRLRTAKVGVAMRLKILLVHEILNLLLIYMFNMLLLDKPVTRYTLKH